MKLITDWSQQANGECPRTVFDGDRPKAVFTIGVFDGLHLGHKYIIDTVIKCASKLKAMSLVLTFQPHPLEILAPQAAPALLTTLDQKAEILEQWGVDYLGVLNFTRDLAAVAPQKFLNQYLGQFIDAQAAVFGPDFSFGQNAQGGPETIKGWLYKNNPKARLIIVDSKLGEYGLYSSSQVRQDLKNGLVETAAKSLGRPYRLVGEVVHGQARGRVLGFPTANLGHINQLIPEPGVYAVEVIVDGKKYKGMSSIGYNPTFGEQPMTVETNIFDFDRHIYGQNMSIDFIGKLRAMARFNSSEQLVEQLSKDRQAALQVLS